MTHAELGAQPPHRPARPTHRSLRYSSSSAKPSWARRAWRRWTARACCLGPLAAAAAARRRRVGAARRTCCSSSRRRKGAGRGTKLGGDLRQGPRLGAQPVRQVGPQVLEAELGDAGGGALLGGALALAGQLLAAGELPEVVIGDGAADRLLGGGEVAGELGDAPAVVQQGLQAAAGVGEAQAAGLLVEVAVVAAVDPEAAVDAEVARQTCWWGCFPCARGAGSNATPEDPRLSEHQWSRRARGRGSPHAWARRPDAYP